MEEEESKVLQEREALVEMYKAGFLDAYKLTKKLIKKEDWTEMNKAYKMAFFNRFEKKITKLLKEKKKCKKKS